MNNKTRVLITGGCGFVGHHIVEGVLKNTDWDVIILDILNYAGNLNYLVDIRDWEKYSPRVRFVWHDLKAPISETTRLMIGEVDYVWHLAAESHVDRSLVDSIPFAMSNVVGTTNLLEHVKHFQPNLKKFIYFSTDEVFGPAPLDYSYKEEDVLSPSNPYSAAKEGGEAMSKAFAFSFGIPVVITRCMNIFGERQNPEKFFPMTIKQIYTGGKIVLHGTPNNISSRCWIHARNVCDALLFITQKTDEVIAKAYQFDRQRGIFHIVGEEYNVLEISKMIAKAIGNMSYKTEYLDFHQTRPGHDLRYGLDGSKLSQLGWTPKMGAKAAIEKMVKWSISQENLKWLNLEK